MVHPASRVLLALTLAASTACTREPPSGDPSPTPRGAAALPEDTAQLVFLPPDDTAGASFARLRSVAVRLVVAPPATCNGGTDTEMADTTFGPAGGVLSHPSGHLLRVPPNAVAQGRTVTFELKEQPNPNKLIVWVDAHPKLHVVDTVYLSVNYRTRCPDYCRGPKSDLSKWIVRKQPKIDEYVGGRDNRSLCRIEDAPLDKFSNYALASAG